MIKPLFRWGATKGVPSLKACAGRLEGTYELRKAYIGGYFQAKSFLDNVSVRNLPTPIVDE